MIGVLCHHPSMIVVQVEDPAVPFLQEPCRSWYGILVSLAQSESSSSPCPPRIFAVSSRQSSHLSAPSTPGPTHPPVSPHHRAVVDGHGRSAPASARSSPPPAKEFPEKSSVCIFNLPKQEAIRNKCHASSNRCLTSSNKKLVETSATLVVTGALLVVTRSY